MADNIADVVSAIQLSNQNLSANMSALIAALRAIFPQVSSITGGTFTCANAATTTVAQPATQSNSFVLLFPINAAGGTLQGSAKSLYLSARTANTSFAVTTASGVAAGGTEQFLYVILGL